jgi:kinesin family protein 5
MLTSKNINNELLPNDSKQMSNNKSNAGASNTKLFNVECESKGLSRPSNHRLSEFINKDSTNRDLISKDTISKETINKKKEGLAVTSLSKKLFQTNQVNMNLNTDLGSNTSQIRVISRFRPLNVTEQLMSEKDLGTICAKYVAEDTVTITNNLNTPTTITLDRIFPSSTTQKDLYDNVARSTIEDVLKGYNGTIFTYGQSGSGKTFSMYGPDIYDDNLKGIIPRSIANIFDYINDEANKDIKFELKFSMLEIYKENLHDLLNPHTKANDLKIKEHPKKGIYVMNLTEEYISNEDEFLLLIENAEEIRAVASHDLNKHSSRSHLLFQLEIIQKMPDDTEQRGMLNLIDLAGSEKVGKTHASGEILEEAKKINLSLSTLGNVISALTSSKNEFVPYRDSKLTRILQDSLGGNYKTTLIVTCSPHIYNCEETISTLKFASRAKKIKNKVKLNIKRSVEQLEAIIENLNKQLILSQEEINKLKLLCKSNAINFSDSSINIINLNSNCASASNFNLIKSITPTTVGNQINEISPSNSITLNNTQDYMTNPLLSLSQFNQSKIKNDNKKNIQTNSKEFEQIMEENISYSNIIKQKDKEIQHLNEKLDNLQEENKSMNDKINRMSRETGYIYFYQILENLENFTKKNIEEIKCLKLENENKKMEVLIQENECLRENLKNLEKKQFLTYKDIEIKLFGNQANNSEDDISYFSNEEDLYDRYQLNFSNFFDSKIMGKSDKNNLQPNSGLFSSSYKNIYDHSKLYLNKLLKEFLKRKDLFGSKFGYSELLRASFEENTLRNNYRDLKNSYMKMNFLMIYYEKIIFDLMNRVLVDISIKNYFNV